MPRVIRLEKVELHCPRCGKPLTPQNWFHSPFDYIKKAYCEPCDIIYEYEMPRTKEMPDCKGGVI
jgi:predicted amidophosphoribosyltransferase